MVNRPNRGKEFLGLIGTAAVLIGVVAGCNALLSPHSADTSAPAATASALAKDKLAACGHLYDWSTDNHSYTSRLETRDEFIAHLKQDSDSLKDDVGKLGVKDGMSAAEVAAVFKPSLDMDKERVLVTDGGSAADLSALTASVEADTTAASQVLGCEAK